MTRKEKFEFELIDRSKANSYTKALTEWNIVKFQKVYLDEKCLCGNSITNLVYCINKYTKTEILTGSCCCKKFMKINVDSYFTNLNKLKANLNVILPINILNLYYNNNVINEWEYSFLTGLKKFKRLSIKQMQLLERINLKILEDYESN
jgi:hypothetical protein